MCISDVAQVDALALSRSSPLGVYGLPEIVCKMLSVLVCLCFAGGRFFVLHKIPKALTKLEDLCPKDTTPWPSREVPLSGSSSCPTLPALWPAPGLAAAGCRLVFPSLWSWALCIFDDTVNFQQTFCFTTRRYFRLLLFSSGLGL